MQRRPSSTNGRLRFGRRIKLNTTPFCASHATAALSLSLSCFQLRTEVDKTIQRLNVQRAQQVARCQQFEQNLQANIEAMQQMQQQVRRRAVALGTAFDACVSRLSTAHVEAVAVRRQQAVAHGFVAPPTAAPKAAVALQPGQ